MKNWPQNYSEGKFVATPKTVRQGLWDWEPLVMGTIKKGKKDSSGAWTINQNANQRTINVHEMNKQLILAKICLFADDLVIAKQCHSSDQAKKYKGCVRQNKKHHIIYIYIHIIFISKQIISLFYISTFLCDADDTLRHPRLLLLPSSLFPMKIF